MMNYKSKTKEQLILELETLKQDYDSLKALYDKDIAKSKQNEIDLQISEAQKNAILNAISASITFVDRNLNIIWTNKTAANLVNKNANEMIGKTCHHFWGDPAKPCENCTSLKALETKQTEKNIIQTPNGKVWEEKSEPVFDAQGNLIGIVEIATDITALKLAEEEKRKADTRLRTLSKAIEQSPVTTVITDLAGNIEFVNPKFTETTGYTAEEAIGKNPRILKAGNKMVSEYRELWDTIISGKNWHGVFQNKKKNGEIYWESAVISPVKDEKGNITHFLAVKEDITSRKQTEVALAQSRSELKAIYDFSPVMMCLVDAKRKIIFANPAFTALTGTDEVLLQGGHACGVFGCINATDDIRGCGFGSNCRNCSLRIAMEDTLKNGTVHLNVEYHTTLVQNGETRKVSLLGSTVLIESNNQRNLLLCLIDITERKQAEVLLQKSQDNLNKAQQLAHLGSWEWDMNSNLLTCSDEFYRIFGLKTQTPTINTDLLIDFIHPDDKDFYLRNLERAANIGESQSFEYRIVRPDGEIRNIFASGSVVFDENNKPCTGTGVVQDITKRKKGLEALRESEKKYRLLTENTADVIWMLNLTTGKFTYISPSVFQLRGYTAEEAMNERLEDSLTPDSKEIVKNAIEKDVEIFLANPGLPNSSFNEIQQYCKNGKVIWVEVSTQLQFNSTGDIEVLGISRNIEERKKAENALRASEQKFKAIIDTSPDGIAITALDGTIEFVTEKIVSMWGYDSADEIIGKNTMEFIDSSYHEKAVYLMSEMFNDNLNGAAEYLMVRKDGSHFYAESNANILRDAINNAIGILYIERDITERKKVEQVLQETNAYLENLFNYANAPIIVWDPQFRITRFNHAFEHLTGLTEKDVLGQSLEILFPSALAENSMQLIHNTLTGERWETVEIQIRHIDNSVKTVLWNSATLFASDGKTPIATIAQGQDITLRKQTEKFLKESEEKFRTVFYISPDAITLSRLSDNVIVSINKGFTDSLGYSEEDVVGKTTLHFDLWVDTNDRTRLFDMLKTTGKVDNFEAWFYTKKRELRFGLMSMTILDINGEKHIVNITRDITERKQAEEKLRKSEQMLNESGRIAKLGGWEIDLNTNQLTWSEETYRIHEVELNTPQQMQDGINFYAPEAIPVLEKAIGLAMSEGTPFDLELPFITAKGNHLWVRSIGNADLSNGKPVRLYGVFHDITERKLVEEALKYREEQFRNLFVNAPVGIFHSDWDGRFLAANPTLAKILGYSSPEELINTISNMSAQIYDDPSIRPQIMDSIKKTSGWVHYDEIKWRRKDNYIITVDMTGRKVLDNKGNFVYLEGFIEDITERKLAEEALIHTSTRLTLATLAGGVGVWDWDVVNNLLLWDDQMFALYGVKKENFSSAYEAWLSAVHPDYKAQGDAEIQMALSGEKQFDTEFKVLWPDGSIHNIRALAIVQRSSSGKPLRMIGTNWDITEQKKTEALLVKAKQEAEMANKAKSIFLANMSHEIRTPLNAIIGFTQLMNRDKALTETQKEYNAAIIRSGEHLLMLINDILELSKMEAGRVVLNPVNVDLLTLFNDIQSIFKEKAQSKHLRFVFETAENIPHFVRVDESKLRQIFINLIGNALKFTDHGGITVSARVDKVIEGTSHLFVEIEDTGSGIAEDELSKLFNQFTQTSAGINKGSGTGLGLALSRELAILMGGNITVSSKVGKGSVFSFHVEVQEGKAETQNPVLAKRVISIRKGEKPRRILVVDDKKENLQVVVTLLNMVGFETIEAVNGEDAISKFEEYHPDLILMDLRMPLMDGYEATRRIKLTEKGKQTPIIALTASTFEGHKKRIETLGIQGYISKPFRETELFGIIGKVLGINYDYEEEKPLPQNVNLMDEGAVSAAIGKLPESLKLPMLNAAAVADINLLKNLISSIQHDNEKLAMYLMEIAKNYDYDYLLKLLKNKGE